MLKSLRLAPLFLAACGSPPSPSPPPVAPSAALALPPPVMPLRSSEPITIAAPTATAGPSSSPTATTPSDLDPWISLRDLSMREALARFSITTANIRTEGSYQGLDHLTELYKPAAHPARFFFRDGTIAIIHVGDGAELKRLRGKAIFAQLGGEGILLRSRACTPCNEHVYPEKGLTVSGEGDDVSFVDVYPPTTLAGYLKEIYIEPGAFVR
jgi:hypothetical protein